MKQRVHETRGGTKLVLTDESGGGWDLIHDELRAAGTATVHVYVSCATRSDVIQDDHLWPNGRRADDVLADLEANGPDVLVEQHADYLCHRNPEPTYDTLPCRLLEAQFTIRPDAP